MNEKWLKGVAVALLLGGAVVFVGWLFARTLAPRRGLNPGEPTELELTCVNEECPGRHTDPNSGQRMPHTVRKMLPGGFTDWPLECPACGQKSLWLIMECPMCSQLRKKRVTWKILNASDTSQYACPECGFSPYE